MLTGCGLFVAENTEDYPERTEPIEPQPFPIVIDDVVIEESPEQIISLSPALTEILFEFGYGNRLVGTSRYCDYPPGVNNIGTVESGSGFSAEIERIIRISPDLLLLSSPISDKDRVTLQREGIAVVIIPAPHNLAEFRSVYNLIGVILYGGFVGNEKGESAFSGITQACNNPEVLDLGGFVYVTENMAFATGDTLESSILSRFGTNLAEQGSGYVLTEAQTAELLETQPDVVLLNSAVSREALQAHPLLSQLEAVTAGRIIVLDNERFERPSSRIIELIYDMKSQYALLN
jgi:iron complex transport system substrate-binding protein